MVYEECSGVEKEILIHLSTIKETNLSDLSSSTGRSLSNTYKIVEKLVEQDILTDDYKHDKGGIKLNERIIRLKKDKVKIKTTYKHFITQQVFVIVFLLGIMVLSFLLGTYLLISGALIFALLEFIKNAWDFRKDPDYRQVLKDVVKKTQEEACEKPSESSII
jgi:Ca2+-dependent lipid-binding protein